MAAGVIRALLAKFGLDVDRGSFKRGDVAVDDSKRKLKSLTGAVRGLGRQVTGAIAGFVGLGAAISIGKGILATNVQAQRLNAQLIAVTGSTEKAEKAFDFIKEFAKTTPFELGRVVEAFVALKAGGLEPTAKVMRSVGNLAAANSSDIKLAAVSIIKANRGLVEGLATNLNIFGKVSKNEVELIVQGQKQVLKRGGNDIQDFLLDLGNTQFAAGMSSQMDTLGGKFSNLADVSTAFKVAIGSGGLNDAIIEVTNRMIAAVGGAESLATVMGEKLGVAVIGTADAFKVLAENQEAAQVGAVAVGAAAAAPTVSKLGGTIMGVLVPALGFMALKGRAAFTALAPLVAAGGPLLIIGAAAVAAAGAIFIFRKEIGEFADKFKDADTVLGDIARTIDVFRGEIGPPIQSALAELSEAFEPVVDGAIAITRAMFKVLGAIAGPIGGLIGLIVKVSAALSSVVIKVIGAIVAPIAALFVFVGEGFAFLAAAIQPIVQGIVDVIGSGVDIVADFIDSIVDSVNGMVVDIGEAIFGLIDGIKSAAATFLDPILDGLRTFINDLKSVVAQVPDELLPEAISRWAKGSGAGGGGGLLTDFSSQLQRRAGAKRGASALLSGVSGVLGAGGGAAGAQVNIQQTNTISIDAQGMTPGELADATRKGQGESTKDLDEALRNVLAGGA